MNHLNRHLQDAIYFVVGVIVAIVVSELLTGIFSNSLILLIAITLILITFYVGQMSATINETVIAMGIRARYIEDRWIDGSFREGRVFEAVRGIISEAKEEILIAGYNDPRFDPPVREDLNLLEGDEAQRKRERYFEMIENKVRQNQRKPLRYTRIIQMPNVQGIEINQETLGPLEYKHCQNILLIKASTQNPGINILKMETERISTFMIVDQKILVLSDLGKKKTETGHGNYLAGIFIIEDYTGTIIQTFTEYFWNELVPKATPIELEHFSVARITAGL